MTFEYQRLEFVVVTVFLHIPTSSSWLKLIERWFREITDKRIRRGTFHGVKQLIEAIMGFFDNHNAAPKSFIWTGDRRPKRTAEVEDILAKVRRARAVLDKVPTE